MCAGISVIGTLKANKAEAYDERTIRQSTTQKREEDLLSTGVTQLHSIPLRLIGDGLVPLPYDCIQVIRDVNSNGKKTEKSVSGTIYVLHEAGEWLSRRMDKNESGRTGRARRMAFLSGQPKGLEVGQMGRRICTQ